MKTIGLIGGMSWESTIPYYKIINEEISKRLGGLHSAKIVLYSVNFDELNECLNTENWDKIAEILGAAAEKLQDFGADFILICTNTMHKVAPVIQERISVPIVHIADATGDEIFKRGFRKVALLGTKFTMTQNFYTKKLHEKGLEVMIPDQDEIVTINDVIFKELCAGIFREESRQKYKDIIRRLQNEGAEAVIFGCTEIGLLLDQKECDIPVFDTTVVHAKKAAEMALA